MQRYLDILKQYWGYSEFRPLQPDIIKSIGAGRDTLALMPTGGGKSITFQVPALAADGVCIVVTPLIALMKDQVNNLRKRGIMAKAIFSGQTRDEINVALDNCVYNGCKFLYVSPERLSTEIFQTKFQQMNVSLIAVDEAHCISQWGYDFRPSYMNIALLRDIKPDVPILALTATATAETVTDIMQRLRFRAPNVLKKSFARENIAYMVRNTEAKVNMTVELLNHVPGSAIVYVRSRKKTWETAQVLNGVGIPTAFYHAGMSNQEKDRVQADWECGIARVIVCTNAFGMGIDKPDVRLVVHLDPPDTLEAYFQEAGRAGRDGKPAYAVFLWSSKDAGLLRRHVTTSYPPEEDILAIYNSLCNSQTIGVGSGEGYVADFDLISFCKAFNRSGVIVSNALSILSNAGYINYQPDAELSSRVIFIVDRSELYNLEVAHPDLHVVIQALLRTYTGLFMEYAVIDEDRIAKMCKLTRQDVYERLKALARMKVLLYNPQKHCNLMTWTRERVDERDFALPRSVYHDRYEQARKRSESVISYCESSDVCRSQMLLAYFGETDAPLCGHCDVCKAKKRNGVFDQEQMQLLLNKEHGNLSDHPSYIVNEALDRGQIVSEDGEEFHSV